MQFDISGWSPLYAKIDSATVFSSVAGLEFMDIVQNISVNSSYVLAVINYGYFSNYSIDSVSDSQNCSFTPKTVSCAFSSHSTSNFSHVVYVDVVGDSQTTQFSVSFSIVVPNVLPEN